MEDHAPHLLTVQDLQLEYVTQEPATVDICERYWRPLHPEVPTPETIDGQPQYAYPVADIASEAGLPTPEITKLVSASCTAIAQGVSCPECLRPYSFSNRSELQKLLKSFTNNNERRCPSCKARWKTKKIKDDARERHQDGERQRLLARRADTLSSSLEQHHEKDPRQQWETRYRMARLYNEIPDFRKALEALQPYLTYDPAELSYRTATSTAWGELTQSRRQGDTTLALLLLEALVAATLKDNHDLGLRGEGQLWGQEHDRPLTVQKIRGDVLYEAGRFDSALQCYKDVERMAEGATPACFVALFDQARIEQQQGNTAQLRRLIVRATEGFLGTLHASYPRNDLEESYQTPVDYFENWLQLDEPAEYDFSDSAMKVVRSVDGDDDLRRRLPAETRAGLAALSEWSRAYTDSLQTGTPDHGPLSTPDNSQKMVYPSVHE